MEFSIAERLRQLMESRGWTENKTVALKVGVHPSTIGLLLNSGRTDPGISTVQKLARAFGMTVSQFIGEEPLSADELDHYRPVITQARERGIEPDQLQHLVESSELEPYRAVIQLAQENDMDPNRLLQLLQTVMAVSRK